MNEFDEFDKMLMEKAHNEVCTLPESIDRKIDSVLINLNDKKIYRKINIKIALVAALVAIVSVTTVFAVSTPSIKNKVSEIVSYFNGTKETKYFKDKARFDKFNKSVGVSVEDRDIKLTVNNLALDDNFLNVFYTLENKDAINMNFKDENKFFEAVLSAPFLNFKINGKNMEYGNHNDTDAYFEGNKILKVMKRINVSQISLPENFDLTISADKIFNVDGKWEIATTVNKASVLAVTKTVKPNIKAVIDTGDVKHHINVDKVSISPFGSQIVITEKFLKNDNMFDTFALYDDKGNILDVLNTDQIGRDLLGKSTNSFEFIKASTDIKCIRLVPIKYTEKGTSIEEKGEIKKLPITLKTCEIGSRVVENIEFYKNIIKITYHNEGVELWDPTFLFYDANGKKLELGDCGSSISIDREKGKYTQILNFGDNNPDFSKIAKIGTFSGVQHLELLDNQAIKIELQ